MYKLSKKFGKAFVDQLAKVSFKSGQFSYPREDPGWVQSLIPGWEAQSAKTQSISNWRRLPLFLAVLLGFSLLLFKLFSLQVIEGSSQRELADSNRIQVKIIHAPRGVIYDRSGNILAQNEPGFRLVEKEKGGKQKITYLSRDEELKLEVFNPSLIKNLEIDNLRYYPSGEVTAHVLGYLGEITQDELKDPKYASYKIGDKVGRGGIEEIYEKVLRGIDGGKVIEVDAAGAEMRVLREVPPKSGQNLTLSLSLDLQLLAFKSLKDASIKNNSCCGALIASDPESGEVLSLISYPSFSPSQPENALFGTNSPFLNRVIAGLYPPGSIFKIASSLAGLSSGKINAQTVFEDTGKISLGPFIFSNWYFTQYGKTEGNVDIVKALKRSNDTFYYRLGMLVGEKTLRDTAKKLGLGKKLGIDLPGEVEGVIPDNDWKLNYLNEVWFPGDTLHMAIGQGFVLTTPLQLNNLTSIVAADSREYPPHLAQKITSSDGSLVKEFKYDPVSVNFKKEHIDLVKKGLEEVPKAGGTAWPFFTFSIPTAGKTGTAEYGDPKNRTHAWYTAYAPSQDPKIVITTLVEGGGEGSSIAAPIVKELLRWYLSPDKTNLIKDTVAVASESAKTLGE